MEPSRNFDLCLSGALSAVRVEVVDSPAGQYTALDALPCAVSPDALKDLFDLAPGVDLEAIGRALWRCAFGDRVVERLWGDSKPEPGSEGVLRLRLTVDAAELAALPWELLYDETLGRFLALDGQTPVTRFTRLPIPSIPWPQDRPLRLLFTGASPADMPTLAVAKEWARLEQVLAPLLNDGRLETPQPIPDGATLPALLAALRRKVDIWHFAGHGADDALVFCKDQGKPDPVSAAILGQTLAGEGVRLAVINACRAGKGGGQAISVAGALLRAGVSAVVAMQANVSDVVSGAFAGAFYDAVAVGQGVDQAMTAARKAILAVGTAEWWVPSLFMQTGEGRLRDMAGTPARAQTKSPEGAAAKAPASALAQSGQPTIADTGGCGSFFAQLEQLGDSASSRIMDWVTRHRTNPYAWLVVVVAALLLGVGLWIGLHDSGNPNEALDPTEGQPTMVPVNGGGADSSFTCYNIVKNGGFEESQGWTLSTGVVSPAYVDSPVRTGFQAARLGNSDGPNAQGFTNIRQTISIPNNAVSAVLSFWSYSQSEPNPGSDRQEVLLSIPGASVDAQEPTVVFLRESSNDPVWSRHVIMVNSFIGRSLDLIFNVYNDGIGGRSALLIDDVSLVVCVHSNGQSGLISSPDLFKEMHVSGFNPSLDTMVIIGDSDVESFSLKFFAPGVTEGSGPGLNIECWFKYAKVPSLEEKWSNPHEIEMEYLGDEDKFDLYGVSLGPLPPGMYSYAPRCAIRIQPNERVWAQIDGDGQEGHISVSTE